MKILMRSMAFGAGLLAVTLIDGTLSSGLLIKEAEARIGRPMTPVSYAGVARRTTRRVIYRTTVYVATLPANCTTVVIEGTTLKRCSNTYYQSSGNRYVIVNIN